LEHLELELSKILMQVRNGINTLKADVSPMPDGRTSPENFQIIQEKEQSE